MQPLYNPIRVLGDKHHMQATLVIMCGRQKGQEASKRVLACFTKSSLPPPPPFYAEQIKLCETAGAESGNTYTSTVCHVAADTAALRLSSLSRSLCFLALTPVSHSRNEYVLVGTWYETQKRLTRRSEGVLEHVVGDHVQLLLLLPLDVH